LPLFVTQARRYHDEMMEIVKEVLPDERIKPWDASEEDRVRQ
jgi:hypothetical protein